MKRLAPILILAGTIPGVAPAVEWGLPWFHTRPKPVLLDDRSAQPVSEKMPPVSQKMVRRTNSGQDEASRPVWADTHRSHDILRREPASHSSSQSGKQANPDH